jgi:tetratricopeptide (TPR) repeat protein
MPLAIELAAARMRLLSPSALLALLSERLRVVAGGPVDLPARQQTLRDTIAWSYHLLDADQQRLFRILGVFAGGFALEAVATVATEGDPFAALEGLEGLVDQSLIVDRSPADGEPRFAMLETIREFALEQLRASGDERSVREAQASWGLTLATQVEAALSGPEERPWLARLDAERDNLRAALEWAAQADEPELTLQLAMALWPIWTRQGHVMEGQRWLERALAAPGVPDATRAQALYRLGSLAIDLSDYTRARAFYEASLALCHAAGDERGVARARTGLGIVATDTGAFTEARQQYRAALAIHEHLEDSVAQAWSRFNLGQVASASGALDEAWEHHQAALTLRRGVAGSDTTGIGYSLFALGQVARRMRRLADALAFLDQSLQIFQRVSDRQGLAYATLEKGRTLLAQGDMDEALPLLREATATFSEMGDWLAVIDSLEAMAVASWQAQDRTLAVRLLDGTSHWREYLGLPVPPVERQALAALGHAVQERGQPDGRATSEERPPLERLVSDVLGDATTTPTADRRGE